MTDQPREEPQVSNEEEEQMLDELREGDSETEDVTSPSPGRALGGGAARGGSPGGGAAAG